MLKTGWIASCHAADSLLPVDFIKISYILSPTLLFIFSEKKIARRGITKFCVWSYILNSIYRYHCMSCSSIALIFAIQQLFFH